MTVTVGGDTPLAVVALLAASQKETLNSRQLLAIADTYLDWLIKNQYK